ncbi:PREDICTED: 2-oxoglutarate and iron-dependent oxygenase domain-containing protein 3-like [Branchiostoma belcheri]|uniref:2-oxoglutarate and iron-dependent oxygenase domain-containing protein 3-like n=1 Tax=Branchiostoma belcheri TaxID=7741 RepID=A0A6P4Y7X2_BRABE|nr:PREDICTED: 2-oxoglutarate and iron-dependent oxygenase domain-containing protein 3-like [Branchiostoma belcheri]
MHAKTTKRILLRVTFIVLTLGIVTLLSSRGDQSGLTTFVRQDETVRKRTLDVPCSKDYKKYQHFEGCTPRRCGRGVMDGLVTHEEAKQLQRIAKRGLALGGSNGGASILDLHSGALSKGDSFINLYELMKRSNHKIVFSEDDFSLYRKVKNRIRSAIAAEFGIEQDRLHLTHPTFFSRMTTKPAKTVHDEYWHPHIDKETYGSFDYTSLLYLSDYGSDFTGGRFVFVDKEANSTVEPRTGRVSFFTSGSENLHFVEKLASGTRFAITVSFSCDKKHAIDDPHIKS